MSPYPTSVVIILTLITLLAASGTSLADSPPDNTIPIIGIIFYWWKWTPELLCEMSWMHFDGIEYEIFESQEDGIDGLMASIDSCGMYVVLNSADLNALAYMGDTACRAHYGPLGGSTAFIEVNGDGGSIVHSYYASSTDDFIDSICVAVNNAFYDYYDQIWFYRFFDEPAANQRKWMYDPNQDYDDYFPSYLTQVTSKFSADSAGTYSWIKKLLEDLDSSIITSTVFAGAQRIYPTEDWAGAFHGPAVVNAHGRAEIVRGFCNMEYQDPLGGIPIDNSNDLVMVDIYPFRHVGSDYQELEEYTPALGDSLHTWLLDHMEEAMDSIFLAAVQEGCEVLYWPQTFGIAGGAAMWTYNTQTQVWSIEYESYFPYRIPTPAETRMHINLALLRQTQGLLPFCIATYTASSGETIPRRTTGLLDNDMIPFDTPFEEWAYTGRPQDSLSYIRPDLIEPFISSFDPLYSGPGPIPYNPGEQQRQDFLEWKFAPYGRLWNSLDDTFGEISIVAPELTQIHWWDGYEDEAWIGCPDSNGYIPFVQPEIRLFERDGSDFPYLFYVNRQCRQTANRMEIRVDDTDVPDADLSNRVLDHSRRFIIPVSGVRTLFFFQDTLGPGQARLVEFIDVTPGTAADLRITPPDIWAEVNSDTTKVYEFLVTAGDEIDIFAEVYNMGTYSVDSVVVTLFDVTSSPSSQLGRDTLAFDGLDTDGYLTDTDTAFFEWTPTNPGIRRLKVSVASVTGEPDTDDNSASIVFLIQPEDYSTTVRDDAWDMTEGGSNLWNTDDIEAVSTYWLGTAWTDSVSGMFEGRLSTSIPGDDLRGDISLAIPSSSSDWIDSDDYSMLSFGMVSYNPNSNASVDNGCEVYIGFKDSHGTTHWSNNYVTTIRNGWDEWKVYGPFDLDDEFPSLPSWSGNDVQEFWLSFRKAKPEDEAEPIDIRVGWVKLTE